MSSRSVWRQALASCTWEASAWLFALLPPPSVLEPLRLPAQFRYGAGELARSSLRCLELVEGTGRRSGVCRGVTM
eukprot:15462300-Alexandrium_andersonii.AAC.1